MTKQFYFAIGGQPAVGKSSLVVALRKHFQAGVNWSRLEVECGQAKGSLYELRELGRRVLVLGKYKDGDTFPGTDRLSMSCQADCVALVERFFEAAIKDGLEAFVIAEGDRLYNPKMFVAVEALSCAPRLYNLVLSASEEKIAQRRKLRETRQSPTFIKGRITKAKNIAKQFPEKTIHIGPNDTERCREFAVELLVNLMQRVGGSASAAQGMVAYG